MAPPALPLGLPPELPRESPALRLIFWKAWINFSATGCLGPKSTIANARPSRKRGNTQKLFLDGGHHWRRVAAPCRKQRSKHSRRTKLPPGASLAGMAWPHIGQVLAKQAACAAMPAEACALIAVGSMESTTANDSDASSSRNSGQGQSKTLATKRVCVTAASAPLPWGPWFRLLSSPPVVRSRPRSRGRASRPDCNSTSRPLSSQGELNAEPGPTREKSQSPEISPSWSRCWASVAASLLTKPVSDLELPSEPPGATNLEPLLPALHRSTAVTAAPAAVAAASTSCKLSPQRRPVAHRVASTARFSAERAGAVSRKRL
mmetsp:Transcript_105110/g.224507  ORF Transcript_105110/g.224507 Transcript_105110/m.224507 type:complete len:319 (+) Transcript_105110:515-1471(+)